MSKPITTYRRLYNWCDEDLWGQISLSLTHNKTLEYLYNSFKADYKKRVRVKRGLFKTTKFFSQPGPTKFVYETTSLDKQFKRKKRFFRSKQHFNLFKLRVFYGNTKLKVFKNFLTGYKKNQNIWASAAPLLLEGRLLMLLYRTGLFKSIFLIKQFLYHTGVFVNGVLTHRPNFVLQVGDIITVPPATYHLLYHYYLGRLTQNLILTGLPRYLEADYRIGCFMLIAVPKPRDIYYCFQVNPEIHWLAK